MKQIQYYQLDRRRGYCDAHPVLQKVSVYLTSPNDYSKESGMTEQPSLTHSMIIAGEGNGTPLQYSCLENPMDGGAW